MEKAIQLVIKGRVQGVGYRAATQRKASELGLKGWVRNLPGGEVEAFAQGPAADVESLVEWCRRGPALARVSGVETQPAQADPALDAFEIRRE